MFYKNAKHCFFNTNIDYVNALSACYRHIIIII